MNRSDVNLNVRTKSVQNYDIPRQLEEVYIKTDESLDDGKVGGDVDVRSISAKMPAPKSKRSAIDQISYDGLVVHSKKNSDPEPRSGDVIYEQQYKKEFSKSYQPDNLEEEMKPT